MSHEYDDGTLAAEYARASVLASRAGRESPRPDGTERLCYAVYGRAAGPRDYIGGSEAHMLHDAADTIARLTRERDGYRRGADRLGKLVDEITRERDEERERRADMQADRDLWIRRTDEARARARRACQALISAVGSTGGPEDVEQAAARAAAEVERLRAGLRALVEELREHVPDGCAGPRGNAREGACPDCRRAEYIERHLLASAETVSPSASVPRGGKEDDHG